MGQRRQSCRIPGRAARGHDRDGHGTGVTVGARGHGRDGHATCGSEKNLAWHSYGHGTTPLNARLGAVEGEIQLMRILRATFPYIRPIAVVVYGKNPPTDNITIFKGSILIVILDYCLEFFYGT